MRKLLLFILILAASVRIAIAGTEFEYQGFKFYVDDTTSVALTGYVGAKPEGKLVLPSKAIYQEKEYIVDRILENAFNDCDKLTSVYFPATINDINFRCFRGCTSISEYVFDEANQSFKGQGPIVLSKDGTLLYHVSGSVKGEFTVPDEVITFSWSAFNYCTGITKIICNNAREMSNDAFEGCDNLEEVVLSDSMTEMFEGLFEGLPALKKVILPKSLETISEQAFAYCTALEEIHLPKSIKTIDKVAFIGCKSLKKIIFPPYLETIDYQAFAECESLTEVVLPENLKNLKRGAFANCINLKKVHIPNGLTSIEAYTFMNCSKLESINLHKNIKNIGNGAFDACYSLKRLDVYWDRPPYIKPKTFAYLDLSKIELYIPANKKGTYSADYYLWRFFNIKER